ncbi:MAG: phosphoribosyl-ATP pyrophosphohydrolase/phosphoribosyl-AMP cyclohydrolase [Saprospiraceae bacterium]|jgi:phosphoribosyl-ATP pyrophosphohydrolase/phosphoribosyl-AMP cyclohydrolase
MLDINKIDFDKSDGLVPAIIQDAATANVLMLGYMNTEAVEKTVSSGLVTFWSRSKKRLWQKGEESGNTLKLIEISLDCDNDTLLLKVKPIGPTCHTGTGTCWGSENKSNAYFLHDLENVIKDRRDNPSDQSYTSSLFAKGINKVAQKVGEEAVELVIEAKDDDRDLFLNEAADLMYHFLILLVAKAFSLEDVVKVLDDRSRGGN